MSVQTTIENKLTEQLSPEFLEVINQSHEHAGHQHGAIDSHYKVVIVSAAFNNMRQVARHQQMYKILADELQSPVHALVLQTFSPDEWANQK